MINWKLGIVSFLLLCLLSVEVAAQRGAGRRPSSRPTSHGWEHRPYHPSASSGSSSFNAPAAFGILMGVLIFGLVVVIGLQVVRIFGEFISGLSESSGWWGHRSKQPPCERCGNRGHERVMLANRAAVLLRPCPRCRGTNQTDPISTNLRGAGKTAAPPR